MRLLSLLLVLVIAACGPVPKPFQHEGSLTGNTLVRLDDAAGVAVLPVSGMPGDAGGLLAAAIAAGFRDVNVPAGLGETNRSAKRLRGVVWTEQAIKGRQVLRFEWSVEAPDGAVLAEIEQKVEVDEAPWNAADPGVYAYIGGKTAEELLAHVQQDYGELGVSTVRPAQVVLWEVSGAPDGGNKALRSGMLGALTNRKVEIFRDLTDEVPILMASVVVADAPEASRPAHRLTIDWILLQADGEELGRMSQSNLIPKGRLAESWGRIGFLAAEAVADDLAEVLRLIANDPENQ